MALEDVELDAHHTTCLENDNSTGGEGGVVDEDLEEGRIPVMETVKVDALDEDNCTNEARGGFIFVPVQGKRKSVVERTLERSNVAVDYFRSFKIHEPSV